MGTIYKYNDKWRVIIRHTGFITKSGYFESYKEAKAFHDDKEAKIQAIKAREKKIIDIDELFS